jgi:hypothetical protein
MTVKSPHRDMIVLEGVCPSEDAEILLQRLLAAPAAVVDLRGCDSLHAAAIQVLLAAQPTLQLPDAGSEAGSWLRAVLLPAVTG